VIESKFLLAYIALSVRLERAGMQFLCKVGLRSFKRHGYPCLKSVAHVESQQRSYVRSTWSSTQQCNWSPRSWWISDSLWDRYYQPGSTRGRPRSGQPRTCTFDYVIYGRGLQQHPLMPQQYQVGLESPIRAYITVYGKPE
jgi:hypothetical protein